MVEMVVCALADSMASSDSYSPSLRFSLLRSPTRTEHKVTHTVARIGIALRIHDILVWIRIRIHIHGSMPLTNGSGSCYFRHWPSRCQQKNNLKKGFSAYYFLKVHLHHFSKNKKSKKKSRNSRNQGFFLLFSVFLFDDRRIRTRIHTSE